MASPRSSHLAQKLSQSPLRFAQSLCELRFAFRAEQKLKDESASLLVFFMLHGARSAFVSMVGACSAFGWRTAEDPSWVDPSLFPDPATMELTYQGHGGWLIRCSGQGLHRPLTGMEEWGRILVMGLQADSA